MTTQYYEELAKYFDRDLNLTIAMCQSARVFLAWQWNEHKKEPLKFYKESELYLFDLALYQTILHDAGFHSWFEKMLQDFSIKTVLDFGGGIGEYALIACKKGLDVDYMDVNDSKTEEYAKYRFKRQNVNPGILQLSNKLNMYDLIVSMDVFEHIDNNIPVIEEVAKHCKYLVCNTPEEIPYDWMYPQHISRIELTPHFEHVSGRLWKSRYN